MKYVVFSWISLVTNQVTKLMQNLHVIVSQAGITLDESCIQLEFWKG